MDTRTRTDPLLPSHTPDLLQQLRLLQLCDSAFPTGAFAYSDGLETAVHTGHVCTAADLYTWMTDWLQHTFRPLEGPALVQAMRAWTQQDLPRLQALDEALTAFRPAAATRISSTTLGKRLLKATLPQDASGSLQTLEQQLRTRQLPGNHLLVWGVLAATFQFPEATAASAFAFQRLNSTVSAALRLFSIGQQAGQQVLSELLTQVPAVVDALLQQPEAPLQTFNPWQDVAQMSHRFLYTRLFRS